MPKKQKKQTNPNQDAVVGLETHTGQMLVLYYDPSEEDVRQFVETQNSRYRAGQAGNESTDVVTNPAFLIKSAARFENQDDATANKNRGEEIDISDLQ